MDTADRLATLSIRNVSFAFGTGRGKTDAVRNFSLEVTPGSFTTLLGPSGCGKTTLLRLISGFLAPESGSILIGGKDQKGIAPNMRKVGMVFQDYALFPHLTVEQNLLYGLKLRKDVPHAHWSGLIQQTARILGLAALLERYPHELSGGQQQRVALGRVLVLKPAILLMDEPLSSLDAKLRTQVREELQDIQKALGITTVYVTHDQEEALSMSDTVAVLSHGELQQVGRPEDVYFRPKNRFVADFVGRANFIDEPDGSVRMIRPEWLSLCPLPEGAESGFGSFTGTVISSGFSGPVIRYRIRSATFSGGVAVADVPTEDGSPLPPGAGVAVTLKKSFIL